jgi:N-acetylglucosamine-6-phosphate deacetylase
LVIHDDRIDRVFAAGESLSLPVESTIDCDGWTVYPGFIDLHIHGAIGVDTMAANGFRSSWQRRV